jgi:hypothetical protein
MSHKTIIDIINGVLSQSGFLKRPQIFNSNDPDDIQMGAIANRVALEITGYYEWEELRKSIEIPMNSGQTIYDLPTDVKSIVGDSSWETDGSRMVMSDVSDNEWYQYKFSSLTTAGVIRGRKVGDTFEVIDPINSSSISMEYVTDYFATSLVNIPLEEFSSDTDMFLLDDQVLSLGIQAHWMQTKLMPQYAEMFINYKQKMGEAVGRNGVRNTIGGPIQQTRRSPYTKTWVN